MRYDEVHAVLEDPRFDVPAAPEAAHGLAWLRWAASRFSRGEQHARRRGLTVEALKTIAPQALRTAARLLALEDAGPPNGVPVAVLAKALGAGMPVAQQVELVTSSYFGAAPDRSTVDKAVEELVAAFGGTQ